MQYVVIAVSYLLLLMKRLNIMCTNVSSVSCVTIQTYSGIPINGNMMRG